MKPIFTTTQAAKICNVAPRTVSKWFDTGRLGGYRIPGSQDRRIPREKLIQFLKEHGMPLGELEDEAAGKVLLIGVNEVIHTTLTEALEPEDFKIESAKNGFEAGVQAKSLHPDCIVISFEGGTNEAAMITRSFREKPEYVGAVIIGLAVERYDGTLNPSLFTETFRAPFDGVLLATRIRTHIQRKNNKIYS